MTNPVAPETPQEPTATPNYGAPNYANLPPTPQAPKKSFNWLRIVIPLVVIAVIAVGGYVWKHVSGDPDIAQVGNCLSGQSEDEIKVVDCGPSADWKVVGKVDNVAKPDNTGMQNACAKWPTFQAAFWKGPESGKDGYILCLAPAK